MVIIVSDDGLRQGTLIQSALTLLPVPSSAYFAVFGITMPFPFSPPLLASAGRPGLGLLEGTVPAWIWLLVIACTGIACVTDLRSMRIPNWLTLPMLAGGLAFAGVTGGWQPLLLALAGAAIAGSVFVFGYVAFGGGAGDAKLMMACGAWLGVEPSTLLILTVTIAGFIQAMIIIVSRGGVQSIPYVVFDGWYKVLATARGFLRGRRPVHADIGEKVAGPDVEAAREKGWFPYAPAIFLGTISCWWILARFGGKP